jgi:hypothetical protein
VKFPRIFPACALGILLCIPFVVSAHNQGPERVVDGKYVVLLLLQPKEEAMHLRFFFRDMQTGREVTLPVSGFVEFLDADTAQPVMEGQQLSTENGKADMTVTFPHDGLYHIELRFQTSDRPGYMYKPEAWDVWMPGTVQTESLPFGVSEWLTVGLGGGIMLLIGASLLQNRGK